MACEPICVLNLTIHDTNRDGLCHRRIWKQQYYIYQDGLIPISPAATEHIVMDVETLDFDY
jgi:hypothetical protein